MEGVKRSQTGVNPLITTSAHRGNDKNDTVQRKALVKLKRSVYRADNI